jgi:hypothetical protein
MDVQDIAFTEQAPRSLAKAITTVFPKHLAKALSDTKVLTLQDGTRLFQGVDYLVNAKTANVTVLTENGARLVSPKPTAASKRKKAKAK